MYWQCSLNRTSSTRPVAPLQPMTDASRLKLRKHRVAIVADLEVGDILNDLIQEEVITEKEYEIIKSKQKQRSAKAEYLLDILPRKGERAFTVFCQALSKHYPFLLILQEMLLSDTDEVDRPANLQVCEPNDGAVGHGNIQELVEELKLENQDLISSNNNIHVECQRLKLVVEKLESQQAADKEKYVARLEHQCLVHKHDFIAERKDREKTKIMLQKVQYQLAHMEIGEEMMSRLLEMIQENERGVNALSSGTASQLNDLSKVKKRDRGLHKSDVEKPKDYLLELGQSLNVDVDSKPTPVIWRSQAGVNVIIHCHDIAKLQVDVIVNSTDKDLKSKDGIPKTFSRQAGTELKEEFQRHLGKPKEREYRELIVTGPGRLNCHKVYHIILTQSSKESNPEFGDRIERMYLRCLRDVNSYQLGSIGFPAIGSDSSLSKEDVSNAIFRALKQFCLQTVGATKHVKVVHIVNEDQKWIKTIQKIFAERADEGKFQLIKYDASLSGKATADPLSGASGINTVLKKTADRTGDDECVICKGTMKNPKTLHKCQHTFCKACIDTAFKHRPNCPVCLQAYGIMTGNQPADGKMSSYVDEWGLPGYEKFKTFTITYSFPDGIQTEGHPHPGKSYSGITRVAYLPANPKGIKVVDLLKRAFDARLVFTIGKSCTTGLEDVLTWNDIHHKTYKKYGGSARYGYPDDGYLKRVTEELAAKGIVDDETDNSSAGTAL